MMKRYLHVTFTCSNIRLGQLSWPHSPFLSFNRAQIAYNSAFSKSCLLDFTQSCVFSGMILPSTVHSSLRWQIFLWEIQVFTFCGVETLVTWYKSPRIPVLSPNLSQGETSSLHCLQNGPGLISWTSIMLTS